MKNKYITPVINYTEAATIQTVLLTFSSKSADGSASLVKRHNNYNDEEEEDLQMFINQASKEADINEFSLW